MEQQNLKNHARMHPLYHYVLSIFVLASFGTAITYLITSWIHGENKLLSVVLFLLSIVVLITFMLLRMYPLRAQDRAIRAEEALRYYILTGERLPSLLSIGQVVALRFASDEEFPSLCERAVKEGLEPATIKKEIQQWKGDYNRL
ncbi:hypothetical protein A374_13750 [Fictibacillus macauensis ZFHKF-1]|uniref:Uncharacterized protein n=2 Tax=Fictibacillus TaxID=1329200 RepID=I8UCW2_9BACL|nr:hypothetical protein A374_13750 [Fictibacillus macauensis ZFHKF-1]